MIEMDRENCFRKNFLCGANHRFQHALIGILSRPLGKLNYERSFALCVAAEQTEQLFHIINVIRPDSELAISDLVKLSSGDDHVNKDLAIQRFNDFSIPQI